MSILGVSNIELLYHGPQFSADGPLIGLIAQWVADIREPSASWLVYIQQVGKGVPTCRDKLQCLFILLVRDVSQVRYMYCYSGCTIEVVVSN